MGSSRVGSNPTRSVIFIADFLLVVQQEPFLLCQISLAAMAEWLRRLTRNQMGSSRVGSNPTRSVCWFHTDDLKDFNITCALSGNRTLVSGVAGENSTTEPTMPKPSITIHLLVTIAHHYPGSNEQCLKCVK